MTDCRCFLFYLSTFAAASLTWLSCPAEEIAVWVLRDETTLHIIATFRLTPEPPPILNASPVFPINSARSIKWASRRVPRKWRLWRGWCDLITRSFLIANSTAKEWGQKCFSLFTTENPHRPDVLLRTIRLPRSQPPLLSLLANASFWVCFFDSQVSSQLWSPDHVPPVYTSPQRGVIIFLIYSFFYPMQRY